MNDLYSKSIFNYIQQISHKFFIIKAADIYPTKNSNLSFNSISY